MAQTFLQSLGQALRGIGASTSDANFQAYNRQNELSAERDQRSKELALGLMVKAVENGMMDPADFQQKASALGYADLPSPGKSVAVRKMENEQERERRMLGNRGEFVNKAETKKAEIAGKYGFRYDGAETNPDFAGRDYGPAPHLTGENMEKDRQYTESTFVSANKDAESMPEFHSDYAEWLESEANNAYAKGDKEMGDRAAALAKTHREQAKALAPDEGKSPWGTINPKDFTSDSIKAFEDNFRKTGEWDRSLLVRVEKKPDTEVTVTVNTGKGFWEEVGKGAGKSIVEQRNDAIGHVQSIETIHGARRMLDDGAFTGFGSNVYLGFGRALKAVGFDAASDPVANTEAYAAYTGKLVGQIIKQFGSGTGLSDADREYAQKIAAGDIALTEPALRKLLDLNEKASRIWLERYNRQAKDVDSSANIPFKFTVDTPPDYERQETPAERAKRLEEKYGVDY